MTNRRSTRRQNAVRTRFVWTGDSNSLNYRPLLWTDVPGHMRVLGLSCRSWNSGSEGIRRIEDANQVYCFAFTSVFPVACGVSATGCGDSGLGRDRVLPADGWRGVSETGSQAGTRGAGVQRVPSPSSVERQCRVVARETLRTPARRRAAVELQGRDAGGHEGRRARVASRHASVAARMATRFCCRSAWVRFRGSRCERAAKSSVPSSQTSPAPCP